MADIRINSLPSTATSFNADDYIAIDGASAGTRKMLAATPPFTDVTLGASGPSVKSTLSARAPRQGLVFDGTAGALASATVAALGTSPYTYEVICNPSSFALQMSLVDTQNGILIYVTQTTGLVTIYDRVGAAQIYQASTALAVGKTNHIVYSRASGFYLNGVALSTSITDGSNYTGTALKIGADYLGGSPFTGFISARVYNRALSAAEVVALYEAGVPSGADYNNASNTNLSTSAFTAYNTTSFTGVSATGFTAVSSAACEIDTNPNFAIAVGQRIRATFSITVNSGTVYGVLAEQGVGAKSATSVTFSTGTYSIELVATGASSNAAFLFSSTGASNFVVSSFSAVRAGLLLAPDAAQAGGGSVWYDTSGNAANITLPASGVSWNVPTSGKINNALAITNTTASTTTSTGALVVGNGTSGGLGVGGAINAGSYITAKSDTGGAIVKATQLGGSYASNTAAFEAVAENATSGANNRAFGALRSGDTAYRSIITCDGSVFFGSGSTSPETSLSRNSAGQLTLDHGGGSAPTLSLSANGSVQSRFFSNGSNTFLESYTNTPLILRTNQTTALTITTGQQVQANATTASASTSTGALVVSGGVGVAKEVYIGKTCKVGTGSDNEGYTNVFTNKAENTAGPFDITLPSDCVGVVFLNSYQGGVGRSFREIPFICFGGTVTLGTSRTTVLTADPVTSVAAAASSKITISLYAANTNCYWGIYVNKS